jgi:hypothetical protein
MVFSYFTHAIRATRGLSRLVKLMPQVFVNCTVFRSLLFDDLATHAPNDQPTNLYRCARLVVGRKYSNMYVTTCFDRATDKAVTPNIYSTDTKSVAIYSGFMIDSFEYTVCQTRVVTWEVSVGNDGVLTPIRIYPTDYSS